LRELKKKEKTYADIIVQTVGSMTPVLQQLSEFVERIERMSTAGFEDDEASKLNYFMIRISSAM
jgi:hypothetical protein